VAARFPLYKGATRVPTVARVPLIPAVALVIGVASATVLLGVAWLALLIPGWLLMAQVTRTDDRAFRVAWLWAQTKLANRLRLAVSCGLRDPWGASSYALTDVTRRSWEGKESRWAG
jgi:type IV secretion system protein VirB3